MDYVASQLKESECFPGLQEENKEPSFPDIKSRELKEDDCFIDHNEITIDRLKKIMGKGVNYRMKKLHGEGWVIDLSKARYDVVPKTPDLQTEHQFDFNVESPLPTSPSSPHSPVVPMKELVPSKYNSPVIFIKNSKPYMQIVWVDSNHRFNIGDDTINAVEFAWKDEDDASNNVKSEWNNKDVVVLSQKGRLPIFEDEELVFEIDTILESYCNRSLKELKAGYTEWLPIALLEKMTYLLMKNPDCFLGGGWTCDAFCPDPIQSLETLVKEIGQATGCMFTTGRGKMVYKPIYKGALPTDYNEQCFLLVQSEFYKAVHLAAGVKLVPYRSEIVPFPVDEGCLKRYMVVDRQEKVEEEQFLHKRIENNLKKGDIKEIVKTYRKILLEVIEPIYKVHMAIPGLEISLDANTKNFVCKDDQLYLTDLSPPAAIYKGRVFENYNILNGPDDNVAWDIMFKLLCKSVFQFCYPVAKMFIHGPALEWYSKREKAPICEQDFATLSFKDYLQSSKTDINQVAYLQQISAVIEMAAHAEGAPLFSHELDRLFEFFEDKNISLTDFGPENVVRAVTLLQEYRQPQYTGGQPKDVEKRKKLLEFMVYLALCLITEMRVERGDKPHDYIPDNVQDQIAEANRAIASI